MEARVNNMPDFNFQGNTFPIAAVVDAYQRKAALEQQFKQQDSQNLTQGLGMIGQVGNSLLQRRMQMAQALAGAKMYASTPEGQAMLNPSTLSETQQMPVPLTQTAQGTDNQGNILPAPIQNTGPAGAVVTRPQTTTTTAPASVTPQDLATAFVGESPSNMLTQLFNRQKERQQMALDTRKQAFTEQIEPQKLAQQAALTSALTGVKSKEVSQQEQNNLRSNISNEEAKQAQYIKDFPELTGTFLKGILPEGSNAKESAAFSAYQQSKRNAENYRRQLYQSGGNNSNSPVAHMSTADLLAIYNQGSK